MPEPSPFTGRSHFLFAACQPGAEAFLKQEIALAVPDLRLSFSRPGLVTFKSKEAVGPDAALDSIFAREFGMSVGPGDETRVLELAKELSKDGSVYLSVFAREELNHHVARNVAGRLRAGYTFAPALSPGQIVLDVIVAPGDPLWLGAHIHGPTHLTGAGGWMGIELPEEAPSRAYLKIEEAIRWSHARLLSGEVMIELGSAPGGASYSVLKRGLDVHGVDPGEMSPVVLAFRAPNKPSFVNHRIPVGALLKRDLPRPTHWLAMDMNLAPRVALRYAERVIGPIRQTLKGAFLTLKLNSLADAREIPMLLDRIRHFGFEQVLAKQLPSHRQEIVAVAFTHHGVLAKES